MKKYQNLAQIMRLSGCSITTARRYIREKSLPKAVETLIELENNGWILPKSWRKLDIFFTDNEEMQTRTDCWHVHAIESLAYQVYISDQCKKSADHALSKAKLEILHLQEMIDYLDKKAPRAPVVELEKAKPSDAMDYVDNPLFAIPDALKEKNRH